MKKSIKDIIGTEPLKKGTCSCPVCQSRLYFKSLHGMRIVVNGILQAKCNVCIIYLQIKA